MFDTFFKTQDLLQHLLILPIVIPLLSAIILFFIEERARHIKMAISFVSLIALLFLNFYLCYSIYKNEAGVASYFLGGWSAPFGIVLVLDRLVAPLLALAALMALASLLFSAAYWHKVSPNFYSFVQFFLVGVNGTFLTGDLFNLFVFFEMTLAASYALAFYGFNVHRVQYGFHYVIINLVASIFFLLGIALIYGTMGTLNLADLAAKLPQVKGEDFIYLCYGGCFILLTFLIKIAVWPVNFWLAPLYNSLSAPTACLFVLLTKMGFYILLRLTFLMHNVGGQNSFTNLEKNFLFYAAAVSMVYACIKILASRNLRDSIVNNILCSSSILLLSLSFFDMKIMQTALYYLFVSSLILAVFFLLSELVERLKMPAHTLLTVRMSYEESDGPIETEYNGRLLPNSHNFLAIAYIIAALFLIGMPPFAGFISKFSLITTVLAKQTIQLTSFEDFKSWFFIFMLLFSSLCTLLVLMREGISLFWTGIEENSTKIYWVEFVPILLLLFFLLVLTLAAPKILSAFSCLTEGLQYPFYYIETILKNYYV